MHGPRWHRRFEKSGYRLTSPRKMVLEVLAENPGHLSADEVFFLVHQRQRGIGLATVYRTLDILVRMGIIQKFDFGDGRSRYELLAGKGAPHHLICKSCGCVIDYGDLSEKEIGLVEELKEEASKRHNFEFESYRIDFLGTCSKCKKKSS